MHIMLMAMDTLNVSDIVSGVIEETFARLAWNTNGVRRK